MAADPVPRREEAHRLIDLLPEEAVGPVVWLLRRVQDPVVRLLDAAPPDDEPLTPEDEEALAEADEAERAGRVRPLDDAFRDLDEAET